MLILFEYRVIVEIVNFTIFGGYP